MPLGTELGLGAGHVVLDWKTQLSSRKGHSSPHFLAHVYFYQTAGLIKIPIGMQV